jgi:hypothetical protein
MRTTAEARFSTLVNFRPRAAATQVTSKLHVRAYADRMRMLKSVLQGLKRVLCFLFTAPPNWLRR